MSDLDLRLDCGLSRMIPLVEQGSFALTLIQKVPFGQDSLALKEALPDSGTNTSA